MNQSKAWLDAIYARLDELTAPNGTLSSIGPNATINNDSLGFLAGGSWQPYTARQRIHDEVVDEIFASKLDVRLEGKAAIVVAGPPGAGKSKYINALISTDPDGWRRIDADDIKMALLKRDRHESLRSLLADQTMLQNAQLQPLELAGLVHKESVYIARRVRAHCLKRGENVIIDGTLGDREDGPQMLSELRVRDYSEVTIVDVEVPLYRALAQARGRWENGRLRGMIDPEGLGGRFVPTSVIHGMYTENGPERSNCADNAEYTLTQAYGFEHAEMRQISTLPGQADYHQRRVAYSEVITTSSSVTRAPNPALAGSSRTAAGGGSGFDGGAGVCRVCGRPLRSDASIAAGVGPRCARRDVRS